MKKILSIIITAMFVSLSACSQVQPILDESSLQTTVGDKKKQESKQEYTEKTEKEKRFRNTASL
ncbi:MAG: hypothetical protein JW884_10480 [Deltaproteobacteria bacterium]|nr:hypothetical protein [Deltaproteobacteria bacterium]